MPGLLEGQEKMSKSDPNSAIFMEDSEAEVSTKIKKAFCPPQVLLGDWRPHHRPPYYARAAVSPAMLMIHDAHSRRSSMAILALSTSSTSPSLGSIDLKSSALKPMVGTRSTRTLKSSSRITPREHCTPVRAAACVNIFHSFGR